MTGELRVIATAGHVDHGKSSLITRMTGMDPDRWAEEKRRGETALPASTSRLPGVPRYRLSTEVPEYWVPLIPVRVGNGLRLRRGALPLRQHNCALAEGAAHGLVLDARVVIQRRAARRAVQCVRHHYSNLSAVF